MIGRTALPHECPLCGGTFGMANPWVRHKYVPAKPARWWRKAKPGRVEATCIVCRARVSVPPLNEQHITRAQSVKEPE